MKISVIIATKDRPQELQRCLRSLSVQERKPDEVVIVDASTAPVEIGEDFPYPISVLRTKVGLTHQRNQGFQGSRGDVVLYLDDDVVLEPEYLAELISVFEEDKEGEIGAATGRITNITAPGWRHPLRSILWVFNLIFQLPDLGSGKFRLSGFPTFPYHEEKRRQIEALSGCNMAFRKQVLQRYCFDEHLEGYAYVDDDDIAQRISRHYRSVYVPTARLAHLSAPKERPRLRAHKRMLAKHHTYLFYKNLPHSFLHYLAFGVSMVGLVIATLVVEWSPTGVLGLLEGLVDARRSKLSNGTKGESSSPVGA